MFLYRLWEGRKGRVAGGPIGVVSLRIHHEIRTINPFWVPWAPCLEPLHEQQPAFIPTGSDAPPAFCSFLRFQSLRKIFYPTPAATSRPHGCITLLPLVRTRTSALHHCAPLPSCIQAFLRRCAHHHAHTSMPACKLACTVWTACMYLSGFWDSSRRCWLYCVVNV